jgi:hypothetical protein
MRGSDLSRLPEDIVGLYDDEPADDGELVFQPRSFDKPAD